ncbi:cuticle collagen rol-6-like [Paramacrobiotus metropolitanus]|uniref:cuticle collagen rol-6-like n=1 Tax=Paramacrobiotus metropolitanus TaxID=2943436 RepID=UPI00244566EC|nr:cuticle collagen rol-6-like [Paramacrobiotus metropolitanus]
MYLLSLTLLVPFVTYVCGQLPSAQFSAKYPLDRKLQVATVEIPYLFNKADKSGFFPELLRLLAEYGNLNVDLDNIHFSTNFDEAKDYVANKEGDILAVAVENDGIYKSNLNFTYPIFGSKVVQVKSSQHSDVTTVSVLSTTPTQDTIKAQPGNFPGMSSNLGPPSGSSSQPGSLDDALNAVENGKATFLGRTPVLDTAVRSRTSLTLSDMSTPLVVYSGFAVGSAPIVLERLNAAIIKARLNNATQKLFLAKFPHSTFLEPPLDKFPQLSTAIAAFSGSSTSNPGTSGTSTPLPVTSGTSKPTTAAPGKPTPPHGKPKPPSPHQPSNAGPGHPRPPPPPHHGPGGRSEGRGGHSGSREERPHGGEHHGRPGSRSFGPPPPPKQGGEQSDFGGYPNGPGGDGQQGGSWQPPFGMPFGPGGPPNGPGGPPPPPPPGGPQFGPGGPGGPPEGSGGYSGPPPNHGPMFVQPGGGQYGYGEMNAGRG